MANERLRPDSSDVRQPERRRDLTTVEQQVLLLMARGLSDKALRKALGAESVSKVKTLKRRLFHTMGVGSATVASLQALREGIILPKQVLGDFDTNLLQTLSVRERELFEVATHPETDDTSNEALGDKLFISRDTVKTYMHRIGVKLPLVKSRTTLFATYLAAKMDGFRYDDEREIGYTQAEVALAALAKVQTQDDVMAVMHNQATRTHIQSAREKLGTKKIFDTIFASYREGILDSDEALKGFDEQRIETLSDESIRLLERFIKDDGEHSTYQEIMDDMPITRQRLDLILGTITHDLALVKKPIHPAVAYYIWKLKQKPDQTNN